MAQGLGNVVHTCFMLFVRHQHEASIPVWSPENPSGSPTISVETRLEWNQI